jgi:fructokinase
MQKIFCFGELLWDLLPAGKQAGGAPMNVAYHLHRLGLEAFPITAVGKDELGNELLDFVKSKRIPLDYIQQNAQPTGKVSVQLNDRNEASYTIHAPAAWDFIELTKDQMAAIQAGEYILLFGSLACRNSINRNTLERLAAHAGLRICDINLRVPFYNKELVERLFTLSDWIKINHEELELITSWYRRDLDTEQKRAYFILQQFAEVDLIVVTRGASGAAYYDRESEYNHPGYQVTVADTIGSGDSFLAMFIAKALQGHEPKECLQYACAMGSTVATYAGATPEFDIDTSIQVLIG